jgi:hypothetical protein
MSDQFDDQNDQPKDQPMKLTNLGAYLMARDLLIWSKAGKEDDAGESFLIKMNRPNFIQRAFFVGMAVNSSDSWTEAAQKIQSVPYFSDVSTEALAEQLALIYNRLSKAPIFKFSQAELGTFAAITA